MDADLVKLVTQSGVAVAALVVLAKIVARVGERMILAIDRVSIKIDEHTKTDTLALADVGNQVGALRQDIAVLASRVDTVIDWGERTPVGGFREPAAPDREADTRRSTGVMRSIRPEGEYSIPRPPPGRGRIP